MKSACFTREMKKKKLTRLLQKNNKNMNFFVFLIALLHLFLFNLKLHQFSLLFRGTFFRPKNSIQKLLLFNLSRNNVEYYHHLFVLLKWNAARELHQFIHCQLKHKKEMKKKLTMAFVWFVESVSAHKGIE